MTIPTWVGRHGQFSLDERRLLTHHMDKNNEMVLTYSRDSLTALHTKVYKVLQLIKSAEFDPDAKPAEAIRQEEDLFADPSEPVAEHGTPAIPTVMRIHSGVMHIAGSDGALKCGRGLSKNLVPASVKQNELADYNQCLATH